MANVVPARLKPVLPIVGVLLAIALARFATFTDWAAANSGLMAILFAWIVVDALMLGLLAKAENHKPPIYKVLSVLALASVIILAGAAAPVRDVYLGLPQVLIAASATVALFLGWTSLKLVRHYRQSQSVEAALASVLPARLVHFMLSETRILTLGLFRWNAPADVPAGAQPFIYHTYLTPMIATFVALQVIEIGVVHLLVMLWNPAVAWALFALSAWGLIWTVALLKSFRIYPVLLNRNSVRVRSGMIYDFDVPLTAIDDAARPFTAQELEDKSILNLALMSSPNISLRFSRPVGIPTFTGSEREIDGVALRLDDSAAFLRALSEKLDQR